MALDVMVEGGAVGVPDAESWQVDENERLILLDASEQPVAEFYTWVGVMKRGSSQAG
jgi:hypothetical protein